MGKSIRRRVERLEESLGPDDTPCPESEDLSGWLELLDNWPEEYACKNIYATPQQIADNIARLRSECQEVAERVRVGELTSVGETLDQLPDDAVLGVLSFLGKRGNTPGGD